MGFQVTNVEVESGIGRRATLTIEWSAINVRAWLPDLPEDFREVLRAWLDERTQR